MSDPIHPAEASALSEAGSEIVPPLASPDVFDPVIEVYKKKVDRTQIRENLRRMRHEHVAPMRENILHLRELYSEPVPRLAPPDVFDPVIEAYKKDVDRTLIRENLKLTPEQRVRKLQDFTGFLAQLRKENSVKP